ncbi:MAG: HD domain-containing protein [Nitrospirae bacterium]|nr:HD domain-containing protein [Nitrospirota bacterium]
MIDLCRMVETGDDNTGIHVDRVGEYSFRMARELGFGPEECDVILLAASIHDIGVSRPGESHPQPLAEPDVNLSAHPAPIIQPSEHIPFPSEQMLSVQMRQFYQATSAPK